MISGPSPRAALAALLVTAALLGAIACAGGGASRLVYSEEGHRLDHLEKVRIEIDGHTFEVWLAETQTERAQGLKGITEEELAPLPDGTARGMLFVWPHDTRPSFWMRDTITALDLAYIQHDGLITEIHALEPLDETRVPASTPIRYALEVRQGTLAAKGITAGDVVLLPPGLSP